MCIRKRTQARGECSRGSHVRCVEEGNACVSIKGAEVRWRGPNTGDKAVHRAPTNAAGEVEPSTVWGESVGTEETRRCDETADRKVEVDYRDHHADYC
jgi:hypothetical protein